MKALSGIYLNLNTEWFKPSRFKGAASKMSQAKVLTVENHSRSRVADGVHRQ